MFEMPLILNVVGESRLDLVIDRYRLAFIEPCVMSSDVENSDNNRLGNRLGVRQNQKRETILYFLSLFS